MSALETTATTTTTTNRSGAAGDEALVGLWIATKGSPRTRLAYAGDARLLLGHLHSRNTDLRGATVTDLVSFAEGLTGSAATKARRVSSAKSLLTFAARTGYAVHNVGAVVQAPKRVRDVSARLLSEADVARLLSAAEGQLRAVLRLLYRSGARAGEVLPLRWKDVHASPDGSAVVSIVGKGQRLRHVRIDKATVVELGDRGAPDAWVFPAGGGHHLAASTLDDQIKRLVRKALPHRAAELLGRPRGQSVSAHWLRHAHASHALDRGAPVHLVSATLGHADLRTTAAYAHARPGQSSGDFLGA